jgi:hypothetical protein
MAEVGCGGTTEADDDGARSKALPVTLQLSSSHSAYDWKYPYITANR